LKWETFAEEGANVTIRMLMLMDDENWHVKSAALQSIGSMSTLIPKDMHKKVIKTILESTNDPDFNVKIPATESLGKLKSIIPASIRKDVVRRILDMSPEEGLNVRGSAI